MCLLGNTLYVADRKNHAIRALDLKAETGAAEPLCFVMIETAEAMDNLDEIERSRAAYDAE